MNNDIKKTMCQLCKNIVKGQKYKRTRKMIAETDKGVIVRQGNGRDSVYERNRENLQKNENDN